MAIHSHGHEHEYEPQRGLPERLPATERILWQGSPDAAALAGSAFHIRKLALYFGLLMAWRAGTVLADGGGMSEALASLTGPLALTALALASVALLAWLTARTAVYTVTNERIVMRIGIVLTLTFNLPLRTIESAALRRGRGGFGDIVLKLKGPDRIAWLQLCPHVRPWRLSQPEPMLRSLPEAAAVAAVLAQAWSAKTGVAVTPPTAEVPATEGDVHAPAQPLQPSPV